MALTTDKQKSSYSRQYFYAALYSFLVLGSGFLSGYFAVNDLGNNFQLTLTRQSGNGFFATLVSIAGQNFSVFLALASGIITFGVSSTITGLLTGIYVGATFAVSAHTIGAYQLFNNVLPYFFLEMTAFLAAIFAGTLPTVFAIKGLKSPATTKKSYLSALSSSAYTVGCGGAALILAAFLETLVIIK